MWGWSYFLPSKIAYGMIIFHFILNTPLICAQKDAHKQAEYSLNCPHDRKSVSIILRLACYP